MPVWQARGSIVPRGRRLRIRGIDLGPFRHARADSSLKTRPGSRKGSGFFCAVLYTAPQYFQGAAVPHSPEEKKRVLARVRRIRGQCDALERALDAGADCGPVLQQIAAIRGAVNGLMSEVMEAHVREEFGQPAADDARRAERVAELSTLIRSYLK